MKALTRTMFKIGGVTYKIISIAWTLLWALVALIALVPASLMDFVGHYLRPGEKQFGIVSVIYIAAGFILVPLRIIKRRNEKVEDCYKVICEDYKNGL